MPSEEGIAGAWNTMTRLLIGCARVSTNDQDLTPQKIAPVALGVTPEKTFTNHGLTGRDPDSGKHWQTAGTGTPSS